MQLQKTPAKLLDNAEQSEIDMCFLRAAQMLISTAKQHYLSSSDLITISLDLFTKETNRPLE